MKSKAQYLYYSTQRPVGPGTFPKPTDNPLVAIENYDKRLPVENGAFMAWGTLTYDKPLTAEQMENYELKPSPKNSDVRQTMYEQAQVVGQWEVRNHISEVKRMTWWYSDFGSFVPDQFVTPEQLAERYRLAVEHPKLPARTAKRRTPPRKNQNPPIR